MSQQEWLQARLSKKQFIPKTGNVVQHRYNNESVDDVKEPNKNSAHYIKKKQATEVEVAARMYSTYIVLL